MINVTNATFISVIASTQNPVVVYVWAPWCGPYKMVGPALERVSAKKKDRFLILKTNIDECENIVKENGIKLSPTLLFASFKQWQITAHQYWRLHHYFTIFEES